MTRSTSLPRLFRHLFVLRRALFYRAETCSARQRATAEARLDTKVRPGLFCPASLSCDVLYFTVPKRVQQGRGYCRSASEHKSQARTFLPRRASAPPSKRLASHSTLYSPLASTTPPSCYTTGRYHPAKYSPVRLLRNSVLVNELAAPFPYPGETR